MRKKIRVNYRINEELKESIKTDSRYKNLSYFVREAVHDMINNPLDKEDIHDLNIEIEKLKLITTTILLFEEDVENINKLKSSNYETYNYDTIYLLSLAVLNYSIKEKLI